jgi:hypothetical protein
MVVDNHTVNTCNYREIWEGCVLADVLATAEERKGLAALNVAKPKAFFDRDAAMAWPETATTERAEAAGRVKGVTEASHLTCRLLP